MAPIGEYATTNETISTRKQTTRAVPDNNVSGRSMLGFGGCFPHAGHNTCHAFQRDALGHGFRLGDGAVDQPLGGPRGLRLFGQKFFNLVHETQTPPREGRQSQNNQTCAIL